MSVINTNYLSMVAQNNLTKSQNTLGSAIERLSSGLRINSARDDAAGQAIANRFTANIKGLSQAARNANDGISLAQTTEGALNEINNNLQRVRELTVQAANKTNSTTDLDSIQAEIKQRLDEIDRVSDETKFNGVAVLSEKRDLAIQVGANDGEIINIGLEKTNATTLGLRDLTVNGKLGTDAFEAYTPAGVNEDDVTFTPSGGLTAEDLASAELMSYGTDDSPSYAVKVGDVYYAATVTPVAATPESAAGADDGTPASATVTIGAKLQTVEGESTVATTDPLKAIDAALQQVDTFRSDLGAVQNRFQSTIANLNNTITNLSAARSRIEDADYATEVSNMGKAQILQQAGTSVLAQANQVPQTVLSLLR